MSPAPRCTQCGKRPRTTTERALIETHEMCASCRVRDMITRADILAAEIGDLAADLTATTSHVYVPTDLEVRILLMLASIHYKETRR